MTRPYILLVALLATIGSACGGDDSGDSEAIRLDDASEEVLATIMEADERGETITDDAIAARLVEPADGAELSRAAPPTFRWTPASSTLRHGRTTGDFVWLSIACEGLASSIELIALESNEWQPEGDAWLALQEASGPCEARVVSAYVDRGVITEGPYQPSERTAFMLAE